MKDLFNNLNKSNIIQNCRDFRKLINNGKDKIEKANQIMTKVIKKKAFNELREGLNKLRLHNLMSLIQDKVVFVESNYSVSKIYQFYIYKVSN